MNKNGLRKVKEIRKAKLHFHGQPCVTAFDKKNSENKRKSAWHVKASRPQKVAVEVTEE